MSNSGVKSGSFDQLAVRYDLSVGEDQDSGEIGQVLTSGGEQSGMTWGSNNATTPQNLVKGTDIIMTTSAGAVTTFNGSVETTISSTHTNTEYQGSATIEIDTGPSPDQINCIKTPGTLTLTGAGSGTFNGSANVSIAITDTNTTYTAGLGIALTGTEFKTDNDGTTMDNLSAGGKNQVLKTPGTLTISGAGSGTFDGSGDTTINIADTTQNIEAGDGIVVVAGGLDRTVKTHIDEDTLNYKATATTREIEVIKTPGTLTLAGAGIGSFDGSNDTTITITDNDTTYIAGDGIFIDTATNPDTIKVLKSGSTLGFDGVGKLEVLRVPGDLKAGAGITFSSGTSYNGESTKTITSDANSLTETKSINPSAVTNHLVYTRITLVSPTDIMYPIDTGYNLTLTPAERYYEVTVQFKVLASPTGIPVGSLKGLYIRIDSADDHITGYQNPALTSLVHADIENTVVVNRSFLCDLGVNWDNGSAHSFYPVIAQTYTSNDVQSATYCSTVNYGANTGELLITAEPLSASRTTESTTANPFVL